MKAEIFKLIGQNCITLEDGKKIYGIIYSELAANRSVELDFTGASVFASPFFNAAIGQLLKDIPPEQLNRLLKVTNLTSDGITVLKRVIENAKLYYSEPKVKQAIDDIITEQSKDK